MPDAKKHKNAPESGTNVKHAKDGGNRVAVIGSGVAGLSAAYLMHRNGRRVTLYESAAQCGGHALTVDSTAGPVDLGFQVRGSKRKREYHRRLLCNRARKKPKPFAFFSFFSWRDGETV
jgi:monoamine oxidase